MLSPLPEVLEAFQAGKMIIVLDQHREGEGDFFVLAEHTTPEDVNFMITHAKGTLCVACAPEILDRLQIPLMIPESDSEVFSHAHFTMTVDAKEEISTGISAPDRSKTIQLLANPKTQPTDLVRPGHIFPLRAQDPKKRFGHTECSVELAKHLGVTPAVAIIEILNKDGLQANAKELHALSEAYQIPMTTREEIKAFLGY